MATDIAVEALRIGLIGYGEVGRILGAALVQRGVGKVAAFDILLREPGPGAEMAAHAKSHGVVLAAAAAELLADVDLAISAVTASEALKVAQDSAPLIRRGAFFLDFNSASPATKATGGELVDRAGGRYVEAAVMASVPPYGIRVPMLLGGPHAAAAAPLLKRLGFVAKPISDQRGVASAIKMCRSVFVKGFEALAIEALVTARAYGVEDQVLASLKETYPQTDWERDATYYFERVVKHGRRRAEEMREAAVTVGDIGLDPHLAAATADRQAWVAALKAAGVLATVGGPVGSWRDYADAILRSLQRDERPAQAGGGKKR